MDSLDTLYLHIGLPKTATTFLQREVFPTLAHLRYLGIPQSGLFSSPEDLAHGQRTLTSCVKRSALLWDRYGETVFRDLFGCGPADRPSGDVLMSDEGVGRAGSRPTLLSAHLEGLARQARDWGFGRVRLLCVVRRQDHWLASHYAQISDRNPRASQEDFEASVRKTLDPAGERFGFGMLLDYAALADRLRPVVGAPNLLVLPYELLVHDSSQFHDRISSFLGAAPTRAAVEDAPRQNVRSTSEDVWTLRPARQGRVLRLRPRRLVSALRLPEEVELTRRTPGGTIRLTEQVSTSVLQEYEPSNRALADGLGIDLARYGYLPVQ